MNTNIILLMILGLSACLTQFATDIYAPSLPSIAFDFDIHIDRVQFSLAIYMIGVSICQLIYGPLSEGMGRKPPMIFGMFLMLGGTLLCLVASSIEMLIIGRLVQGAGAGAAASLWRSIFRDRFSGPHLARYSSYLVTVIMFFIPAAPVLGGLLEQSFGWRSNFMFMAIMGMAIILLLTFFLEETNVHRDGKKLNPRFIIKTYKSLLTHPVFMYTSLGVFLSYGACFSWFVVGPVLLIESLGVSPLEFGLLSFFGAGIGYGLGGILNGRLVVKHGIPTMLRLGWAIMMLSALGVMGSYAIWGLTMWGLILPVTLSYFGSSLIWPNSFATAFTPFGHIAGYAGSLYGAFQLGGAGIFGSISALFPTNSPLFFSGMLMGLSAVSWIMYETCIHPRIKMGGKNNPLITNNRYGRNKDRGHDLYLQFHEDTDPEVLVGKCLFCVLVVSF